MKVTAKSKKGYQVELISGQHRFLSDEPEGIGDDAGPDPYGLLLAALGACKVMTARLYAERKGFHLEDVEIELSTHKVHAKDCEDCESDPEARVDIIESQVRFQGELDDEQRARLAEIVDKCPVHRTLTTETKIRTRILP